MLRGGSVIMVTIATHQSKGRLNMNRMKVHLDTDLGSDMDDLCALAMLLRWPGWILWASPL